MVRSPLQINEDSYKLLVESVSDYAIFMIDLTGHIISWNKGAQKIKGYTAEEIIGKSFSIFYTPEQVAIGLPQRNLHQAFDNGHFEDEGWRVRKDGSKFWANVIFTALRDLEGNIVGFGKVTRDMTRRRNFEQEIQLLNQVLRDQLKVSQSEIDDYKHALEESSIVAITDQKGTIKYVNHNFCLISKYSREELIGRDHRIINSGFHSKEFIRELWSTIAHGNIWRGEIRNRAKDGSLYWVDTTIVPFLDKNKKPFQYVAIRNDISKRKIAEDEVIRHNENLERTIRERTLELTSSLERERELGEMKSRFVSLASHEFRTPLTTMLSSISLVEKYAGDDMAVNRAKHIDRIKSSIRNLTDILDDFLSLEKLEQGRVETIAVEFDLEQFLEEAIGEMEGMVRKKDQIIFFTLDHRYVLRQDKKILHNILLNLFSNASKYSGVGKKIGVDATFINDLVSITVTDEGIGIPPESQADLFSKFHRARNAANIQGTGLGLYIVKRYVELIQGTIHFKSVENQGSTFTICFPRQLAQNESLYDLEQKKGNA